MNRILNYYFEARERAKQKKSPWNFGFVLLFFTGIGVVSTVMFKGLTFMQSRLIPSEVILSSTTSVGVILMLIPPFFLAFPLAAMFANIILYCIPSARRTLNKEVSISLGVSFKDSIKFLFVLSMLISTVAIPLSVAGMFNYFYVTTKGVTTHSLFEVKERQYSWDDVLRVHASCRAEENRFFWSYVLYMKDARSVDLWEEPRLKFIAAYDLIKPFLRAQKNIVYDYQLGNGEIEALRRDYPEYVDKVIRIVQNKE